MAVTRARWLEALTGRLGEAKVMVDRATRAAYGFDATHLIGEPEAVVLPESARDVAEVLRVASEHGVPVFPRGAGTGLSGGSVPAGGIALVTTRMRRIQPPDPRRLAMVVEAGAVTADVRRAAAAHGLFYPPDPGSSRACTIGGNVAENAAGPHSFQYGPTGHYVLGLEVVLASGEIATFGAETAKNVTGYDVVRLMVGSEGTLGVITAATLRLVPLPRARASLVAAGASPGELEGLVVAMARSPYRPSSVELLDRRCVALLADLLLDAVPSDVAAVRGMELAGPGDAGHGPQPALVLADFLGEQAEVAYRARALAMELRRAGARCAPVLDGPRQERLWGAREHLPARLARLAPTKISEDATVPLGQLAAFLQDLEGLREQYGVDLVVFGHAGDGNLHPNLLTDERDPERMGRALRAVDALFEAALARGGTLSGEHGVGRLKLPYMEKALGPVELAVMAAIKRALDPAGILNPGKAVPTAVRLRDKIPEREKATP